MKPAFLLEYKIHWLILSFWNKCNLFVKRTFFCCFCLFSSLAFAQLPITEHEFLQRIKAGSQVPEKLLSTRSVVFFPYTMTKKELETIQTGFQKAGIDAVAYLERDLVAAGRDVSVSLAEYLNRREISNLIIFKKADGDFVFYAIPYNNRANLVNPETEAWVLSDKTLDALLQNIYRTTASALQRENLLINDVPEITMPVNPIYGRRSEFYAIDLNVDRLAVPTFGDSLRDAELAEIMKMYPYKYQLVDGQLAESEIRRQGFLFVLRFVHARASIAKTVLGYDLTRSQSAIVSVTYPGDQPHLKSIPANAEVFKFYFKHVDSGNVFLGTKWDADIRWQDALINQIRGFKAEFKIN